MKKLSSALVIMLAFGFYSKALAQQPNIIVTIDTTFAHSGKVEIPLSQYGDEATDFTGIYPDKSSNSKVTVCGKVGTATPGLYYLGMVQLHLQDGTFDTSFGQKGISIHSWGMSDYPNTMYISPYDSSITMAGASKPNPESGHIPALFKLKNNGVQDSSFGGDGHVLGIFGSKVSGEFTNIYSVGTTYIACGRFFDSTNSTNGFCAMRFFAANGKIDSTFGINGRAMIVVPASKRVSSVTGFLTVNDSITFIGTSTESTDSTQSEIVFGRLTEKGIIDTKFGADGFLKTGVTFSTFAGDKVVAAIQPNFDIVAALPPNGISLLMPFSVIRFTNVDLTNHSAMTQDTLFVDTTFGNHGNVTVAFGPEGSRARGITIDKNAKASIAGSTEGSLEHCATTRLDVDGTPDITLNKTGKVVIDVDSGKYSNYIIKFLGTGFKRYISVGSSIHGTTSQNGKSEFLVARFKDDTLVSGEGVVADNLEKIDIFPNPVSKRFTIMSPNEPVNEVRIIDVLGRFVESNYSTVDFKLYSIDVSRLHNGTYYCLIETKSGGLMRKIIVVH